MKKNYTVFIVLVMFFGFFTEALAADVLNLPTKSIVGKFETVTGGLAVINEKGAKKSYIKAQNQLNKYTDYITYRKSPFSRDFESTPCEVLFVDTYTIKIKTPTSGIIEIPRYRVKDLEINIK